MDWDPAEIPPPLLPDVVELVTLTTARLADEAGAIDTRALRRALARIWDRITAWSMAEADPPPIANALEIMAQTLTHRLTIGLRPAV